MALVKRLVSITVCKIYILDNYLQHEWSFPENKVVRVGHNRSFFSNWNFWISNQLFSFSSLEISLFFTGNSPFRHLEFSLFSPGILLFFTWNFSLFHLGFFFISPGISHFFTWNFLYFTWNFPLFHLEFSFFSPGIFFISPEFPLFSPEIFFISPGIFLFFTWNFPFFHLEFSLFHLEILVFFSNVIASIFHFITLEFPLTGGYGCFFLEKPSFLKSNFHVLEHENSYLPFIV